MVIRRELTEVSPSKDRDCILRICEADFQRLQKHLFQRYPDREWGTFFRFGYRRTSWGLALSYVEPVLPGLRDLDRRVGLTRFTDAYSRRAFQQAVSKPFGTGVVHSHPEGARTWPSSLDDDMDTYFAREFTAYSGGAPYCSLILQRCAETGLTFTGRVFDRGEWSPLISIISVGASIDRYESEVTTTTAAMIDDENRVTARLESLMGLKARRRLNRSTVGIIGCSGTGSPGAHVLARAQVGSFVLVDPQRFAPSNHERFHASVRSDIERRPIPYKVELVRNHISSINPDARVTTIAGNILQENVVDELLRCDLLLGYSDTQHARAALSDLATHYLLPSLDVGVLMDGKDGEVSTQLTDVTVFAPELPCGFCAGRIDGIALSYELMSEEEIRLREANAREARERGDDADQYWKGPRQLHTVGYLTTMAGALAAGYAEGWLTGAFRVPHNSLQFDIGRERLSVVAPPRQYVDGCGCRDHRGWADLARGYRNVVMPPHWPRRGVLLHRPSSQVATQRVSVAGVRYEAY